MASQTVTVMTPMRKTSLARRRVGINVVSVAEPVRQRMLHGHAHQLGLVAVFAGIWIRHNRRPKTNNVS
jgi:hypothetical protein